MFKMKKQTYCIWSSRWIAKLAFPALLLVIFPAGLSGADYTYVGGSVAVFEKNSLKFEVAALTGWYRTELDASLFVSYLTKIRDAFIYTGKEAPLPDDQNVKCRLIMCPSPKYASLADSEKAIRQFEAMLAKDGYRKGELTINDITTPCYLSPETERTIYLVLMRFDSAGITVIVETPKPGAKFPSAALNLLSGLRSLP